MNELEECHRINDIINGNFDYFKYVTRSFIEKLVATELPDSVQEDLIDRFEYITKGFIYRPEEITDVTQSVDPHLLDLYSTYFILIVSYSDISISLHVQKEGQPNLIIVQGEDIDVRLNLNDKETREFIIRTA